MKIIGTNTTKLTGIEPREGELLITKIQRAKKHGELIKDVAEIIYTPRKAGVITGHDMYHGLMKKFSSTKCVLMRHVLFQNRQTIKNVRLSFTKLNTIRQLF